MSWILKINEFVAFRASILKRFSGAKGTINEITEEIRHRIETLSEEKQAELYIASETVKDILSEVMLDQQDTYCTKK